MDSVQNTTNEEPSLEALVETFLEQTHTNKNLSIEAFANSAPKQFKTQLLELLPLIVDLNGVASDSARKISTLDDTIPQLPTDDFSITKKIGSGGMGTVYEGIQVSLNRKVAIKILSPSLITDANHRKQFENEAQIIAKLHHPNIVKVLHAGSSIHCCYYVMELIEGKPLNKRCFNDLSTIATIGLTLARALAYAHSCGIMHRDIKPTNILIDENDNVHISDFGLAYLLDNQTQEPTSSNNDEAFEDRSGTIRYMSPERLTKGTNSFVNDQYALGITLYELINKAPVIEAKSRKELIDKLSSQPIPQLKCADADLAAIINKSISFNPENRYKSMNDLADDLQRYLNHEPIKAHTNNIAKRIKLWAKRKPSIAILSATLTTFFIALCISCFIGYYNTASALSRAEKSGNVADVTLSHVFDHISNLSPAEKDTELLETLLPYYQIIVSQENLSQDKLNDANLILATTAMSVGKYELAEKAYRTLLEYNESSPALLNQLANALAMQNEVTEARELWNKVATEYSHSESEEELSEAVNALLSLSEAPDSEERNRAFVIIEKLLINNPEKPEYLYFYAQILSGAPRKTTKYQIEGKKQDPIEILLSLANKYPNNREYGLTLLKHLEDNQYPIGFGERNPRKIRARHNHNAPNRPRYHHPLAPIWNNIYELSERMLWLWPNDPEVVNAVINFQIKAIETQREQLGSANQYLVNRLIHLLEMLYYNPDTSMSTKETLISLQLGQLEGLSANSKREKYIRDQEIEKIERELSIYTGDCKESFKQKLDAIRSTAKTIEQNINKQTLELSK